MLLGQYMNYDPKEEGITHINIYSKAQSPRLSVSTSRHLLETCDLPFTHYYVYGNKKVEVQGWDWQVQEWDKIRKRLREDYEQRKARNS